MKAQNSIKYILHRNDITKESFRFEEGGDDIWASELSYYSQAHINLIHSLIDSIINGKPAKYTGKNGLWAVKTTMTVICSAKEGRPVKVSEVTDERYLEQIKEALRMHGFICEF